MRGIRGDLSFRWLFLCRPARERFRNPFWREIHLRQRNAAIEHFAIAGNQSVLQPDLCDSSEKHPRALAARDVGGVGKTVARVGVKPVLHHVADHRATAELTVESVVINSIGNKAGRRGGAVAAADRLTHALEQCAERGRFIFHSALPFPGSAAMRTLPKPAGTRSGIPRSPEWRTRSRCRSCGRT